MKEKDRSLIGYVGKAYDFIKDHKEGLSLSNFVAVAEDGRIIDRIGRACYYSLGYEFPNVKLAAFIDMESAAHCRGFNEVTDQEAEYVDFITRESTFSEAFVTKKYDSVLKRGYWMKTDYPASYIVSAGVHIRMVEEYPECVKFFCEMKKQGVNGDLALFLSHIMHFTHSGQKIQVNWQVNHRVTYDTIGKEGFTAFMNHDKSNFGADTLKTHRSYRPMASCWKGEKASGFELPKMKQAPIYGWNKEVVGHTSSLELKDLGEFASQFYELNYIKGEK